MTKKKTKNLEKNLNEIKIYCKDCGYELDTWIKTQGDNVTLLIRPCITCLQDSYEEGLKDATIPNRLV
jgi:hypothetical protein